MNEDLFFLGAKALIINDKQELLVLKNSKDAWDLPGGRVAKGETIEETLLRELFEEIGINTISNTHYIGTFISNIRIRIGHLDAGLIIRLYHVKASAIEPIVLSDEHKSYYWLTAHEAVSLLKDRFSQQFSNIAQKFYQEYNVQVNPRRVENQ